MTSRLFIALDIPENVLDDLIDLRDQIYGTPNDLRWESKEKMHITIKFLGDVGENISELIIRRLEQIDFEKISANFDKFAFFKKNNVLKILFANLQENKVISEFQNIIESESELIGFTKEKRNFRPHLTMLRLKGKEDLNRLKIFNNYQIKNSEFLISSFSLIKSELFSSGSEYKIVERFNLR